MSREPLTVSVLEIPHRFGAVNENIATVETLLAQQRGVQLALLPETSLTGYVSEDGGFDLTSFAERLEGPTIRRLAELAQEHRVHLAAPLVERAGAKLYNSLVLLDPLGAIVGHYRKRCPWYPERWATPGDLGTPVFDVLGWKLTPAICFDIHFVGELAPEALTSADALLFPSAWVEEAPNADSRTEILSEIAQAFDVAVLNANWGAGKPRVAGQGESRIVDSHGREVARSTTLAPSVLVTTLHD